MARQSQAVLDQRRAEVREYMLKGWKDKDIMAEMKISREILDHDKEAVKEQYMKEISSDAGLYQRQAEHVLKHLDQLDMIKKKLWAMEGAAESDRARVEALKTLLTELEHESKILKLIDTSKTIIKNYIHVDKINVLMSKLAEVVKEFVPPEKQQYAFTRIKELGPILDNEAAKVIDVDATVEKEGDKE